MNNLGKPSVSGGRIAGQAYALVGMMFLFQTLNFFDKLAFGVAAVSIMSEFGLTPQQFGLIGACFFVSMSLGGTVIGLFAVGRFKPKTILVSLAGIWTISQFPIYFTHSVAVIVACRLLLGLGEGAAMAVAMSAAYEWFPPERRVLPTAFILQGISAGFLVGGPLLTYFVVHHGWRSAFLFCGTASLLWMIVFSITGRRGPFIGQEPASGTSSRPLPSRVLWLDPTVVGVMLVLFLSYWVVGMAAVWLPPYLRVGLGYHPVTAGWIISAIYVVQSPILLLGGWITQAMRGRGWSARGCLGYGSAIAMLVSGLAMIAAVTSPTGPRQIVLLSLAFSVPSLATLFGPVILAAVAPAGQRNRLVVVIISFGTISAFFSTYANGWIVGRFPADPHSGYAAAFATGGGVLLLGALAGWLLLFPERTIARFVRYRLVERQVEIIG